MCSLHQMESTICPSYTLLPTAPLRLSSRTIGVRASRVHLSLSHASLCLSHCSKTHPSVNCMLENERFSVPSNNEGSDNNIMRGMTGISLVMACVLGVFNFSSKMNPKSFTAYAINWRPAPTSNQNPHRPMPGSAEFALDSLLNMIKDSHSQYQTLSKPQIPENPSTAELEKLKLYSVGLTKSGKPDEAVELLGKEYTRLKEWSEAENYLSMALIEILILQEKYGEALKRLDDLIENIIRRESVDATSPHYKVPGNDDKKIEQLQKYAFEISTQKIFLYKAISHTMLGDKNAAKWREAFRKTINY